MHRRDDHHNYTERRMYMITLEVEGRHPLFGRIVGDPFASRGSHDEPRIDLSELGKAMQREWLGIPRFFPQIEVKAVQMMPDHMHGILFVKEALPVHLGQVISGFKAGCRKAQKELETAARTDGSVVAKPQPTENKPLASQQALVPQQQPSQQQAPQQQPSQQQAPQQAPIPQQGQAPQQQASPQGPIPQQGLASSQQPSPQVTALPSQNASQPYRPLFAKGYNDLILRSYDELPIWQNYLRDNPRRLLVRRARPEWLRPFFDLQIGSHRFSGIGNRQLLSAPKRTAVLLSRRLSDSEIAAETVRYLEKAREGTVLVSAAISPGEKRVMRAVFDAGLPTIVIMENGFTPLSKPHGEQFDACARGQLLMLSPWEHHNEKKKITSDQCRQMNLMALEICGT